MNSKKYKDVEKTLKEDDKKAVFEAFFFYAGCWAFGGAIGDDRLQA